MADGPFKIKVQTTASIDGVDPITETVQDTAAALVKLQCEVKPGDKVSVRIMPDAVKQPTFLLVKPLIARVDPSPAGQAAAGAADAPATEKIEKTEWVPETLTTALPDGSFYYATTNTPQDNKGQLDQWKPLLGGHVFVNGMAEWVTDMVAGGGPGPLTTLWFWNKGGKTLVPKGKDPVKDKNLAKPATIIVLVVAGYSPEPVKKEGDQNQGKQPGGY